MERYQYNTEDLESRLERLPRLAALAAEATNPSAPPEEAPDNPPAGVPPAVEVPQPPPASATHRPRQPDIQGSKPPAGRRKEAPALASSHPRRHVAPDLLIRVKEKTQLAIVSLAQYIEDARANPDSHLLRNAQIPVFESLLGSLEEEGPGLKGYFSLPTGSGKSVIYSQFIRLTEMKTLVVAPTGHLVKGVGVALNKFNSAGQRPIPVGRIDSTSKHSYERVTATTYASFIIHSLRPLGHSSPHKGGLRPGLIDLLVLDEAHNAQGPRAREAVEQYEHAVQLGFTATENYSAKRRLSSLLPREIHKLTIMEACSFGLISPYSNWVVETGLDISAVRINTVNEYEASDLQEHINSRERNQLVVNLYKRYFEGKKMFVFCSGVEHAQDMSIMFNRMGIPAAAVFGKGMLDDEREDILRSARSRKRGSTMVLCSDRMLLEGTDIEQFSVCMNAVPVLGSLVRAKQRAGRALRLDEENPSKHAIVVDVIDSDYRTAPLLFCEEEIGQTAHIGERHPRPDESVPFGDGRRAVLISDADRVEAMAESFAERRSTRKGARLPEAPAGWISTAELAADLDISPTILRNRFSIIQGQDTKFYEENAGLFQLAESNNRSMFFSPQMAESIRQQREALFALALMEPPPPNWLSSKMIEVRYGTTNAADILSEITEESGMEPGRFRARRASAADVFYSPDFVRKYAERIGQTYLEPDAPPPGWEVLGGETSLPYSQREREHLTAQLTTRNRSLVLSHSVTIGEITYCHPELIRYASEFTQFPRDWITLEQAAADHGVAADAFRDRLYEQYGVNSAVLLRNWVPDLRGGGYISPWFAGMMDIAFRYVKKHS